MLWAVSRVPRVTTEEDPFTEMAEFLTNRVAERVAVMPPDMSEALAIAIRPFSGRWVATRGDEVVGAGDNAVEAIRAAHSAGVDDPVVFPVRRG